MFRKATFTLNVVEVGDALQEDAELIRLHVK
jgi:hypothetical protein